MLKKNHISEETVDSIHSFASTIAFPRSPNRTMQYHIKWRVIQEDPGEDPGLDRVYSFLFIRSHF